MELSDFVKSGIEKCGTAKELAERLSQNASVIRNAKGNRRGLPVYICIRLAKIVNADPMAVIAASELVMETDEEKKAELRLFVPTQTNWEEGNTPAPANADAEMQTAPDRSRLKKWWPSAESNHGHADFQDKTL